MTKREGFVPINGKALWAARKRKRMSREKLAEICGYSSSSTVLHWEKRSCRVDENVIPIITSALDISREELLSGDGAFACPPSHINRPGYVKLNGKRLKQIRENHGMTRKDFARYCGYSYMGMAAIEQGKRKMDETAFCKALDLFDISREELIEKGEQE